MKLLGLQKIVLSVSDMCNRKCNICPHHDSSIFPNKKVWMSIETAKSLAETLIRCEYTGLVSISGYGEPLLHKQIFNIIAEFTKRNIKTRLYTNGDLLYTEKVSANILDRLKLEEIVVTTYNGPTRYNLYNEFLLKKFKLTKFRIRSKYVTEVKENDVSVVYWNRAGTVFKSVNDNQIYCHRPLHEAMIDWDGTVLTCCEDWVRETKYGNILETPFEEIWNHNQELNHYRKTLVGGNRKDLSVCKECNYRDKDYSVISEDWNGVFK